MAKRSLIVGICAFVSGLVPVLGIALGVVAAVLGVLAITRQQKQWMWITGVSLGLIGALTSLAVTVGVAFAPTAAVVSTTAAEHSSLVVPDVAGMKAGKAIGKLEELGLDVRLVDAGSGETISSPDARGKVAASNPEAGTSVKEGSTVTLTLTANNEKEPSPKKDTEPKTSEQPQKDEAAEKPEPAAPTNDIEVLDLSYEGNKFISATFPVSDAFTKAGVIRNLQKGCVEAIQAAKDATPTWYEFDTIQCMGMFDGSELVGSANFSGALLSEISDVEMQDDPERFWGLADRSNLAPGYR